jgi:hypothetical protein
MELLRNKPAERAAEKPAEPLPVFKALACPFFGQDFRI